MYFQLILIAIGFLGIGQAQKPFSLQARLVNYSCLSQASWTDLRETKNTFRDLVHASSDFPERDLEALHEDYDGVSANQQPQFCQLNCARKE